jgi:hypothetical protein
MRPCRRQVAISATPSSLELARRAERRRRRQALS